MSRLCWVLVVLVVVEGRPHNCEQKERSFAGLDLIEDSLNKAKDLYPNCEDEISNSTECSKRDKSLGFIDAALDLVSIAKKNYPVCPEVTTEDEQPLEWTTQPPRFIDCGELLQMDGRRESGVYTVWLWDNKDDYIPVQVRCDMDTDGGGWTVIQRRGNFSKQENFYRDWKDYKNGFGDPSQDFWLGNDNIFFLSNQLSYSLRIDMTAMNGDKAHDLYQDFWIENEKSNYKLHVGKHSGNAGNSMTYHNGNMFSTKDRKNDRSKTRNCAVLKKSGFWHNDCARCNPNGLYEPGADHEATLYYSTLKKYDSLFSMEMKLKRL